MSNEESSPAGPNHQPGLPSPVAANAGDTRARPPWVLIAAGFVAATSLLVRTLL